MPYGEPFRYVTEDIQLFSPSEIHSTVMQFFSQRTLIPPAKLLLLFGIRKSTPLRSVRRRFGGRRGSRHRSTRSTLHIVPHTTSLTHSYPHAVKNDAELSSRQPCINIQSKHRISQREKSLSLFYYNLPHISLFYLPQATVSAQAIQTVQTTQLTCT